jgi:preprotein translocase subunit SecG
MKPDPDKFLNQLVVIALTVFALVIMLLAALALRHLWLQQRILDLSSDVQIKLDTIEETHDEIQRELVEIQTTPSDAQDADNWEEITEVLDDVDEHLDSLEEDLSEVVLALEPEINSEIVRLEDGEQTQTPPDQVDQVFTIFTILVGIASIVIAILLGMALRVQQNNPSEKTTVMNVSVREEGHDLT